LAENTVKGAGMVPVRLPFFIYGQRVDNFNHKILQGYRFLGLKSEIIYRKRMSPQRMTVPNRIAVTNASFMMGLIFRLEHQQ
jgi:hypothetical protein